jgi:hypothetical protein
MRYIASFVILLTLGTGNAYGAVRLLPDPQTQLAFLNAAIENLANFRKSGGEEETEIALRKKILLQIIDLSKQDVQDARRKLKSIRAESYNMRAIVDSLNAELDTAAHEYNVRAENIKGSSSLETIKQSASELLNARQEITERIDTLLLIVNSFENRATLHIVETRLNKIAFDVRQLELLGVIQEGVFSIQVENARAHLTRAKNAQDEIELYTTQRLPRRPIPNMSTETSSEDADTTTATQNIIPEQPPFEKTELQQLLATSLNEIKETYIIFIKISTEIQKAIYR